MSYSGHCNCESIRITLPEKPTNSVICHCSNCKRAGGGSFSLNYLVSEDELSVDDSTGAIKIYNDSHTLAGRVIQRYFCSSCGSPIFTKTPKLPGKAFLKAALFDVVAAPTGAVFKDNQAKWLKVVDLSGKSL